MVLGPYIGLTVAGPFGVFVLMELLVMCVISSNE